MIFKNPKNLIWAVVIAALLLAASYFLPTVPDDHKPAANPVAPSETVTTYEGTNISHQDEMPPEPGNAALDTANKETKPTPIPKAGEDAILNEANPPEPPTPDKPTCTLLISCHTLLNHKDMLKEEKRQLVPPDGVIYSNKEAVFYEGETAFNVLLREMKQNRIHFEFEKTPMYDSMYIEGIGNIYEFDAGDLSGWLYKVNGTFLSYSLSQYTVQKGDNIEIVYTCNMGHDVGGAYAPLQ